MRVSKKLIKYAVTLYLIYRIYKLCNTSESISQLLDKVSIYNLIRLLKGVLLKEKQNQNEYTLDQALKDIQKEIKSYPSHLTKEAFRSAKEKVKLKMDKTNTLPGVEVKIPNPLNLIGGLGGWALSRFSSESPASKRDHNDHNDQDSLVSDLLKESKKLPEDQEFPDYLVEILAEYADQDQD